HAPTLARQGRGQVRGQRALAHAALAARHPHHRADARQPLHEPLALRAHLLGDALPAGPDLVVGADAAGHAAPGTGAISTPFSCTVMASTGQSRAASIRRSRSSVSAAAVKVMMPSSSNTSASPTGSMQSPNPTHR